MATYFSLASQNWQIQYEFDSTFPLVGWKITDVQPGASGAFAGFQPGDTILQVGQIQYNAAFPVNLDVVTNLAMATGHRYFVVKDRNSPAIISANF